MKNKLFENCALGLSEFEAHANARKWEQFGYVVENIKIKKRPSIFGKIFHPLISGYYVVTFDVMENK